jgi:hypothetical protein
VHGFCFSEQARTQCKLFTIRLLFIIKGKVYEVTVLKHGKYTKLCVKHTIYCILFICSWNISRNIATIVGIYYWS